jgi:hypothetical protein
MVAMAALLLLLIAIYLDLGTGRTRVSGGETWLVRVPFSIYLGWITVATIANATSLLDYLNWNGWGLSPETWAVIMLIAAGVITSAVALIRGDVAYVAVIVWALIGIAVKHADNFPVSVTAKAMVVVVIVGLILGVPLSRRRVERSVVETPEEGVRDRW